MPLATAQNGGAGELLVRYRLLLLGAESAPMSTDSGIDLVVYSPVSKQPNTVQVKTNLKPKPGGCKGKAGLDWWMPEDSPAVSTVTDATVTELRESASKPGAARPTA